MEFEITRSRMMSEVAGNPVSALILQVVAYHHLTLVQVAVKKINITVISAKGGNWVRTICKLFCPKNSLTPLFRI